MALASVSGARRGAIRGAAVMICTRDRPRELAACLASCASLSSKPDLRLVICVADNNERPQEDMIRSLASAHGLDLFYGHEPQRGYSSARNRALGLAQAAGVDMAIFIDDDSTVTPNFVTAHSHALARYECDAILGGIAGLTRKPREGQPATRAGTGNVSLRRWIFSTEEGAGLRFDPRLNLLGYEDWEFFGDVTRIGGVVIESAEPVCISQPSLEAEPLSRDRPFTDRRVFSTMQGRNEIVSTRLRHGRCAALLKSARRAGPLLLQGTAGLAISGVAGLAGNERSRSLREAALLRIARGVGAVTGLYRPGFDRPMARKGRLIEVPSTN